MSSPFVLSIHDGDRWIYPETRHENSLNLDRIFARPHIGLGSMATVGYEREFDDISEGCSLLRFCFNADSGYGSIVWIGGSLIPTSRRFGGSAWVSHGNDELNFDPMILSDAAAGILFNKSCALPIPVVKVIATQFCEDGTGERPDLIDWTRSGFHGETDLSPDEINTENAALETFQDPGF